MKHIWQYYDRLDYRALAEKLDEMAREGWQLKRLGILGMTFEPCQPKTVYHKVILTPQLSGEAMPEGWTYLLRSSVRTIITREQPLSEAEKRAEDRENDYAYRWQKNVGICWLLMMVLFSWQQLHMWDQGISGAERLLLGGELICWLLLMVQSVFWLVNALAYRQALKEQRRYAAAIKWRALRVVLWLALIVSAVLTILLLLYLMLFVY